MRSLLPFLAFFGACAAPSVPPLASSDLVERAVTYGAEVFSGKWPRVDEVLEERDDQRDRGDRSPPQVAVGCRVLGLSAAALTEWMGDERAVCAWDAPAGAAAELLRADRVEVLTAPRLVLDAGASGELSMLDQRAFLAGFDVTGDAAAIRADPVVEVANHGFQLVLSVAAESGQVRLEVLAEFVSVQGLDASREVRIPVGGAGHLQQPVSCVQRVSLDVPMTAERELLVRLPGDKRGDARLLVLRAEPVRAGEG